MNKKIIAIAIASALTAPVAMADVTVSGRFAGELINNNDAAAKYPEVAGDATTNFQDGGANTLAFTASSGNVYGKMGLNVGPEAGAATAEFAPTYRDFYIGYKFGAASLQFGTMNGAIKNLEKDMFIATFLQTRGTFAEAATGVIVAGPGGATKKYTYGSSGYVSNIIQYKGKVGGGTLIAQYNPTSDMNDYFDPDEGHMGVSYAGKASGINYYVGYNNGVGNDHDGVTQSNMKLGGSMKFGAVKAGLNYTSADNDGFKWTAVAIDATMGLGNGLSANVNYGMSSGDLEGTTTRVAINKSLAKNANIYAGIQTNAPEVGDDATEVGLGLGISF